jgi:hypothetical protein
MSGLHNSEPMLSWCKLAVCWSQTGSRIPKSMHVMGAETGLVENNHIHSKVK